MPAPRTRARAAHALARCPCLSRSRSPAPPRHELCAPRPGDPCPLPPPVVGGARCRDALRASRRSAVGALVNEGDRESVTGRGGGEITSGGRRLVGDVGARLRDSAPGEGRPLGMRLQETKKGSGRATGLRDVGKRRGCPAAVHGWGGDGGWEECVAWSRAVALAPLGSERRTVRLSRRRHGKGAGFGRAARGAGGSRTERQRRGEAPPRAVAPSPAPPTGG